MWTYVRQGQDAEILDLKGDCVVCHKPLWPNPSAFCPVYLECRYTGFKAWVHGSMSGGCSYTFANSTFYEPGSARAEMTADDQVKMDKEDALSGRGPIAERLDEEEYRELHRNEPKESKDLKF